MATGEVQKRTSPKDEISTEIPKHNRVFTGPTPTVRVVRSPEEALRHEYDSAVANLQNWNVSETLIELERSSRHMLEIYLIAEENTRNRPEVLRSFPKPGQSARQRLARVLAPPKTPRSRKAPVAQEV